MVIRVPERVGDAKYADTPSAVRYLADEFGLRVVVDGSPNSLPPELLRTNRELVMDVEPMSRDQCLVHCLRAFPNSASLLIF